MGERRLSSAEEIELVNNEFKNDNWERAAQDILDFWDDGVRTFVEMENLGEWSRSHYSNVFEEHFVARYKNEPTMAMPEGDFDITDLPVDRETFIKLYQEIYPTVYRQAFIDGANWAEQRE